MILIAYCVFFRINRGSPLHALTTLLSKDCLTFIGKAYKERKRLDLSLSLLLKTNDDDDVVKLVN